jgi:transposase-like protein
MSLLSKEHIRNLTQENNINTIQRLQANLKDIFKDVLQDIPEAELDHELGYIKYDVQSWETDNSRNSHSKKIVTSNLGNTELSIPRDRKG